MKRKTHIHNTIDSIELSKAKYDKNVKELLADTQVLARIVKYTVTEVQHLSIDEIIGCIDTKSIEIGRIPINPGQTNFGRIESEQAENSILNEGYVAFDIRFRLIYKAKACKIIINIEAQKSADANKLGYHLENRIIFYLSRLISSQKETEFFHSEYDKIKKVYSIWICMDAESDGDSVSRISLHEEKIFGKVKKFSELDKMCGIVIRIREKDNEKESKNIVIGMLEDLLRNEDSRIKKKKLEEKYDMKMTVELERSVDKMCNLSDVVEERGIKKGIKQGIEQSISAFVEVLKELGQPNEFIVEKIIEKFGLSESQAGKYVL